MNLYAPLAMDNFQALDFTSSKMKPEQEKVNLKNLSRFLSYYRQLQISEISIILFIYKNPNLINNISTFRWTSQCLTFHAKNHLRYR